MKQEVEIAGYPYLFRYRPDNTNTLDEIEKSYVYFSDRESLNDPFDSNPNLINLISDRIDPKDYFRFIKDRLPLGKSLAFLEEYYTHRKLIELTAEFIPQYLNSFGIACFSMIPYVNMTLWANYANNHQGVCLQYNSQNDPAFFENIKPVKYFEKLEQINFNPVEDEFKIQDVFYIKELNWNYEKELRLIKFRKGKKYHKKIALRNIICGYNVEDDYLKNLIAITQNSHVQIYKIHKPSEQFKVSITQMK